MKLVQLLMILRGWVRSALSTFISLVSLGIGLLCSTILLLFVLGEYRMAESLGNKPDTYMVESRDIAVTNDKSYNLQVLKRDIPTMAERLPDVEDWAVFSKHHRTWQYDKEVDWNGNASYAVTPGFARLFSIKMEVGSLDSVLAHPDQIAITRSYANKIFPDKEPIGQSISWKDWTYNAEGRYVEIERIFNVAAIIDDSEPTFLKFRALFQLDQTNLLSKYQTGNYHGAIRLKEGSVDSLFCKKADADSIINRYNRADNFRLTPLNRAYFREAGDSSSFISCDEKTLWIGVTVAFIILIIAAFNYVNISMMRSEERLKNLAGQRIMGASKWAVRAQIIADTTMTVLVAFGLAITFMEPALGLFNGFMGSNLTLGSFFEARNLPYVIGLLLILIALPAINLIAKFSIRTPLEVFKNPRGNRASAMQTLVIAQFAVSVVLIAFSLNVGRQMTFLTSVIKESERIIEIKPHKGGRLTQEFIDRIKADASTTAFLSGELIPGNMIFNGDKTLFIHNTQPSFFNFLDVELLDGKVFDTVTPNQIVVNETFVRDWGVDTNPIGHEYISGNDKLHIVGLCPDISLGNAYYKEQSTIYMLDKQTRIYSIHLKFRGTYDEEVERINRLYASTVDSVMTPVIKTLVDVIKERNPEVTRMQTMIELFTAISILLTALGMFGLSWYMVARRKKEIALRKVHGSRIGQVVALLCRGFLRWTLIAIIVALPLGYYVSGSWLEGFVYRVDNSLWVLAITALAVSLLTFITVIFQTVRAATANPANAIKTE